MATYSEFSFRTRAHSLKRAQEIEYDLLILGGGITGAATARDAASRGLKVALIEKGDFASCTSSNSSKLIHGGLRYLEQFEFKLVFESLSERAHLLKVAPNMVRPMPFVIPVYEGSGRGMGLLSLGLWLYDTLSLFRTPGFHRRFSRKKLMKEHPYLNSNYLSGGFQYFDASMWDDVMVVEAARAASDLGADIMTYAKALKPQYTLRDGVRTLSGFFVRDELEKSSGAEFLIRAKQVIACVGPYSDQFLREIGEFSAEEPPVLKPSTGIHLVFSSERFPVKTSYLLPIEEDGRVVFVLPRPDFGPGCVMVGTTDGPVVDPVDSVSVKEAEVAYLLKTLTRFFPALNLVREDVLSATVGIRPLYNPGRETSLQAVSREHFVGHTPTGLVYVVGGKYTTHRHMAKDIMDRTLCFWNQRSLEHSLPTPPPTHVANTESPANPAALEQALCKDAFLVGRYGAESDMIEATQKARKNPMPDPQGFSCFEAQFVHSLRREMVLRVEDFVLRRIPLYLVRKDHGKPWIESLVKIFNQELSIGLSDTEIQSEIKRVLQVIEREREHRGGF